MRTASNTLQARGVAIKFGKQHSFKVPKAKRFVRQDTLGDDYSMTAILERMAGKRAAPARKKSAANAAPATTEYKPSLLIDIQAKLQQGRGGGFEHWARIFNIKEMSKTLLFLKENGIDSYEELVKKSDAVSAEFDGKLKRIKTIEARLSEISTIQKYIGTYGKTRDVYRQYIASGRDPDFYEACRADITLHEAAKRHFNIMGYGKNKPLPKISELKQEYAALAAEKKKLYVGYRELKENKAALLTAKHNAARILNIDMSAQNLDTERSRNSDNSYER